MLIITPMYMTIITTTSTTITMNTKSTTIHKLTISIMITPKAIPTPSPMRMTTITMVMDTTNQTKSS